MGIVLAASAHYTPRDVFPLHAALAAGAVAHAGVGVRLPAVQRDPLRVSLHPSHAEGRRAAAARPMRR